MSKNSVDLTRRAFLRRTSLALAAPTIIPASVLGRDGHVAPSEKIILGGIGLGPRGSTVLRSMLSESDVQFVAICDPNRTRREAIKRTVDERYGNDRLCAVPRHPGISRLADRH